MGIIEHRIAGQLPMGGLQFDQLEQSTADSSRSVAGIKKSVPYQGHKQLQLLWKLLLHVLPNAGQNIEQALNLQ